jgi:peptidoglycan/xylan/chitin deacetylase (PgdA/CDA1 family)
MRTHATGRAAFHKCKNNRRFLGFAWIYFLHFTGLLRWAQNQIASSAGIVVLTLHRVLNDPEFDRSNSPRGMTIRRSTYEALLEYISKGFEIVPVSGESPSWSLKARRPRIAITFDDGWMDTLSVAYPPAKTKLIPITVFVCPRLMGQASPFWPEQVCRAWNAARHSSAASSSFAAICKQFDLRGEWQPTFSHGNTLEQLIATVKEMDAEHRDKVIERFKVFVNKEAADHQICPLEWTMNWAEVTELSLSGVYIGSHTQHHQILTRIPLQQARSEIGDSKIEIESRLGARCGLFAYPNGSWSEPIGALVQELGYSQAFSNSPGIWNPETDPFLIPRVNLWEGSITNYRGNFSPAIFAYSVFWRAFTGNSLFKRHQRSKYKAA